VKGKSKPSTGSARKAPGPKPDTLQIEGDWKKAVKKSLSKKKPLNGWPK
jgi:hypothetical protein